MTATTRHTLVAFLTNIALPFLVFRAAASAPAGFRRRDVETEKP
ncbi:MAG TPA: hypothetical protein VGK78_01575 [Nocardioides sp.]